MIRKKLDSRRGVSMVIALVFLLLCAMVGTVALGAASVSAGAVSRDRRAYRETAALTSAAGLLGEELSGMTFTATETETETVTTTVITDENDSDKTHTEVTTDTKKDEPEFTLTPTTALFSGWDGPGKVFEDEGGEAPILFTFGSGTRTDDGADMGLPQVTGKLTIHDNYDLTAVLTCGDSSLTMTLDAQVSPALADAEEPEIDDSQPNTTIKTTVTTYTTTVKWSDPVCSGGAAS